VIQNPLCVLPAEPTGGCCNAAIPPPSAPVIPSNPPGLSIITYRIGTFSSFRRAMLDEVADPHLLDLLGGAVNPFASWHEGMDGDYQTMFIELWAYLADILTFYQERIANEAYLPTATQRDSLLRLAQLIDYRPNPGAGASASLAFTVEKGRLITIPQSFRVGSKAQPGKPAAIFETAAINARGEHSAIPIASVAPTNQFGPLSDPTATTRTIVLKGTNNRLTVGDYVLLVENEQVSGATRHQIESLSPDKTTNTTTITWNEAAGTSYAENAKLYAFRITAGAFGNNAPNWNSLPPALKDGGPFANEKWDDPTSPWYYLPTPGDLNTVLFLDAVYSTIKGTQNNPGWAVLINDKDSSSIFQVVDARLSSKAAYAISARVTQLTLEPELDPNTFPLRSTVILAGSESLTLQNDLPVPDPLIGNQLVLAGLYPNLQTGQEVIVQGNLYDPTTNPPSQVLAAETGMLAEPPALDAANNITTVTLKKPLTNMYTHASTVLMANVVDATQGETVRDEVLGSGDSTAFQSFPLKQKPLTYLPSTDPEGLAAVGSTLTVMVNQVRWNEQATLLESSPTAQDFTTAEDDSGQTTITFGDGINGARPPTGKNNIHARYRKGLGTSGNLAAGGIQQLIDSLPGLQRVTNPEASLGGTDRESISQIRVNAPASLRTFGRAVSVADYAGLALSYPGVAKASASWILRDALTLQALPQPYVQLTIATANQTSLAAQIPFARQLRSFLDKRRDPNVSLRLLDFTPVYIDVAARVDVKDNYPRQATLAAALAALNPGLNPDGTAGYFAFERLEFGQGIHLSTVYAVLQNVPGVSDVLITTLRRLDQDRDPSTVRDDIFIRPTELAVIKNDPTDRSNQFGKVVVSLGKGGFADS